VVDPGDLDGEAFACLRAEEVVLEPGGSGGAGSARNRLGGTVVARADEGALCRVTLDCGFRLVALVTRRSAERLEVAPGRGLVAVIKAPALRLVARRSPR
jgi:molybdate transport system ATP-binding protein